MAKDAQPIGTQRSEYDGWGKGMPAEERQAAELRLAARRAGDDEPPFGGSYSGSETSKRSRRTR